ncbi:uncharacterized protein MAM_01766 [Metarhizium album ARSEF 1941]|uniref:DUF7735 domain-containing protein n=1 Tax=Metarhizium album (strain ARSEF 1941) TaxID=1081103 RepID=A0A0B2X5E8_METAS|nr:uncharacterized protein MAM_01766 [Metarhizium album ARSEF 1941]KHO00988.1 hypothetical protein MAM_01766 [Metarhizium album ARSEF 1941]
MAPLIALTHLVYGAAVATALDLAVIFPTTSPSVSAEPPECLMENYTEYLVGPKPTGTLSDAMASYTAELFKTCTLSPEEWLSCPFPESSRVCAFSSAGPSEVMSAYSDFGSSASSWWFARSFMAEQVAFSCPSRWYKEMRLIPFAAIKLNETISFAKCFIKDVTTVASESRPTATSMAPSTAPKAGTPSAARETGASSESWAARGEGCNLGLFAVAAMATLMLA